VYLRQSVDCLELHDQTAIDQRVKAALPDAPPLVVDEDGELALDGPKTR
jgi:hypothetical protein